MKESRGDLSLAQAVGGLLNGKALTDRPQIQHDARACKPHSEIPGIKFHLVHTHQLACLLHGFGVGHVAEAVSAHEPPNTAPAARW